MKPTLINITELLNAYAVQTAINAAHEGTSVIQAVDAAFKPFEAIIPQAMFDGRHAGYPIEVQKYEAAKAAEQETVVDRRQNLSDTIQNFAETISPISPTFQALVATAEEQERIGQQQHQQTPLFDLMQNLRPVLPVDKAEDRSKAQDNSITR